MSQNRIKDVEEVEATLVPK